MTANIASFVCSELVAELLLCCATQIPNLNGITKCLGGVGGSVAQGGQAHVLPCIMAAVELQEKLTRLLCQWDFSGKDTGVGFHFPPPGDLPDPGIEPASPISCIAG